MPRALLSLALGVLLTLLLPQSAAAQSCGAENQRPCKIWERVPSCNAGLVERPIGVRCVRQTTAAPRPAPPSCGASGQRACTVVERIPSCNANLIEVSGRCEPCGAEGQRACPVTVRVPSCNTGLIEDLARGRCIKPTTGFDRLRADAEAWARRIAPLADDIYFAFGPMASSAANVRLIYELSQVRNAAEMQRVVESQRRTQLIYEALRRSGFSTMTVGGSFGGSVGYGRFVEGGVSLDVTRRAPGVAYAADFESGGLQVSSGLELVVSAFQDRNACIGGRAIGIGGSFDVGQGYGLIMWFDFSNDRFLGFSVNMGLLSVGGGGFAGESRTQVFNARC